MSSNIRELIERALLEAQQEFASVVQRKLAALMGDAPAGRPTATRTPPRPPERAPRRTVRSRVPRDHMDTLRQRILSTMPPGEAQKKAQIMAAARLDEDEAQRVGLVLKRLKEEGLLVMRGQKGAATYTLKAGHRRDEGGGAAG